jgi:hypothetical protein
MNPAIKLVVFVAIVLAVNNFVLYYAIQNNGIHSRIHSVGLMIFLISFIEIVAIAIYGYIHLR